MYSTIDDLYRWREAWFHFADNVLCFLGIKVFVVGLDFFGISWSIHFERIYVRWLKVNLEVESWGKIDKIKFFKDVLFDIFLINCTEVVKTLHIFEFLANLRFELIWYTDDSKGGSCFSWSFLQELSLRSNTVVLDIC